MNGPSSDLADLLGRCQAGITVLLRQSSAPEERAARLADLLLELLPAAVRTACLLRGEGVDCLSVRPEKDTSGSERKEAWRAQLASLDTLATGVQTLPAVSGVRTLAAAIHEEERRRGFLAIALPEGTLKEEVARAEALLAVAAPATALRWAVETMRREQTELARFALLGQALVGLAHELNNALNSMMLQTSVVQLRVDEKTRQELSAIRQHGAQAAALVRSLQHVVQERREKSYAVDLNGIVVEVVADEPELRRRVSMQFDAESPSISRTRSTVKQLVRLILEGVCAGTKAAVRLRTEKRPDGAALIVEMAEAPAGLSEEGGAPPAQVVLWDNLDEVGRQAGQSLLRQLGGTLTVEPADEDTLVLRVVWG